MLVIIVTFKHIAIIQPIHQSLPNKSRVYTLSKTLSKSDVIRLLTINDDTVLNSSKLVITLDHRTVKVHRQQLLYLWP